MLMEWLKPAIDKRLDQVFSESLNDPEIAKMTLSYNDVCEKIEKRDRKLYKELEEAVNALSAEEQVFAYRTGFMDGIALHQEISTIRLQPLERNKEKSVPIEQIMRKLVELAKLSHDRDWALEDELRKKSVDIVHHINRGTDELLEYAHDLNGVPQEAEGGFCRDNWDDDFLDYFSEDISIDECLRRYGERLAALKL